MNAKPGQKVDVEMLIFGILFGPAGDKIISYTLKLISLPYSNLILSCHR